MQDDVVVMVLAGGAGERLYPLTKERAKPAVYFGGPYRIIDFTLSNCINSGLRKVFIALQYKSLSLGRHIRMGWSVVADELGEFIEILSPQKRVGEHWYLGTADAVFQNLYSIVARGPAPPDRALGRSRLQDGLRAHAEVPPRARRRRDDRRDRDSVRGSEPLRRDAGGRRGSAGRIPREAEGPGPRRTGPGVDGHLHLRHEAPGAGARSRCAALDQPRLRQGHHPGAGVQGDGLRLSLHRREQEGIEVLARHRHARRLLRREHGSLPRQSRLQPVRSGMAAAHASGAGAAGEVRLRRRGPPLRPGARLDHLGRVHHLRAAGSRAASSARTCACTASAPSNRAS